VTETVIKKETRDATGTAKGTVTATEIGTATDATLVCYFLLHGIAFSVIDHQTSSHLLTARSRRGGGGDHWEPEDRERRNSEVCFPRPFASTSSHVSFSLLSVAGALAHPALALAPVPDHGVVRLRPVADVRDVRALAVVLLAAVHATEIANSRKRSRAHLVDQ
jgi:hypothetical protein